jgi:hypothetical protein
VRRACLQIDAGAGAERLTGGARLLGLTRASLTGLTGCARIEAVAAVAAIRGEIDAIPAALLPAIRALLTAADAGAALANLIVGARVAASAAMEAVGAQLGAAFAAVGLS